jgi:hypothetical protein
MAGQIKSFATTTAVMLIRSNAWTGKNGEAAQRKISEPGLYL